MRWIWIDRFLKFERGKTARAIKNLSLAEDYSNSICLAIRSCRRASFSKGSAQTGGILVGEANDFKEKVVLAKITSAKFAREAVAGETLIYDCEMVTLRPEGASIVGKVYALPPGAPVDEPSGTPMAEAEIFFAHLDKSRSQQIFGDHNFVFSGELKHLLGLAKVSAQRTDGAS